ncbi:hypothetical protein TNCT_556561 [Trichonephila clavata]|uniref:Uncharacterized protein n=1 Tax=Trichonephila clavata TaxID=2740835 RepID=A0A8X6IAZ1_TRICU|nr:hypothetical protein TNCT_556561 [Trichonephila clavata]
MNTQKRNGAGQKNQTRKLQGRSENEARNETESGTLEPEQTEIRNTGARNTTGIRKTGARKHNWISAKLEPGTILESAKLEPEQYWNPQNWSPEQNRNGFLKAERQLAVFFTEHVRATN